MMLQPALHPATGNLPGAPERHASAV